MRIIRRITTGINESVTIIVCEQTEHYIPRYIIYYVDQRSLCLRTHLTLNPSQESNGSSRFGTEITIRFSTLLFILFSIRMKRIYIFKQFR